MPVNDPIRDFETLRQQLEALVVLLLKSTTKFQDRRRLLHELRLALKEADQLISLEK